MSYVAAEMIYSEYKHDHLVPCLESFSHLLDKVQITLLPCKYLLNIYYTPGTSLGHKTEKLKPIELPFYLR